MKLTVIIVSYNVKNYLEQCLVSLQRAMGNVDAEIYIVDNHSQDDSVGYLKSRFPNVNYISCNHNYGYARANNIAIRQSDSEYVLLLNPDTIVGENSITETLTFMDEHEHAGGLGVRMLKTDGSSAMESRRGLPIPMTAFYKLSGLCSRYPQSHRYGKYYMSFLSWDQPAQIEVISGAFFMIRRKALDKVGLLDEDFFMYGEDIDLSYRLLNGGFQNWYIPVKILHYKGESTQKSSFRYVDVFYKAMLIFFRKHYGNMTLLLSLPIKIAIYAKASMALMSMRIDMMRKNLGVTKRDKSMPSYIFIGKENAINVCRELARNKGLDARFIIGDEETLPYGHIDIVDTSHDYRIVYDIDAYSFDNIFRIFSSKPMSNVSVGTFNVMNKTIITSEDVLI